MRASSIVRALLAFATACILTAAGSAQAAMTTVTPWFKVGQELEQDWTIAPVARDPNTIQIKPRRLLSSRPLRRVLVLYPRASSAYDTAMTKFVSVLGDKRVDAEFTVYNFGVDDARGKAATDMAEANNFDLVLAMGSEATAWLWQKYKGGRLPVVSICSKDPVLLHQMPDYTSGSGTNFAFTSLNMPIDAQMSYVLQLRPNLKNLAILVDANNVSAVETQAAPAGAFARARGIRVFDLAVTPTTNIKADLAKLVRDAVATMRKNDPDLANSIFWITGSTTVFSEIATINAQSYRVPVLSTVTDVVQPGDNTAALSVGISFESNAHQAALYAVSILDGNRQVGELPVGIVSPPDVAISFRKAREIGLRVPFPLFEGATVIYDNDGRLVRPTKTVSAPAQPSEAAQTLEMPASNNPFSIE